MHVVSIDIYIYIYSNICIVTIYKLYIAYTNTKLLPCRDRCQATRRTSSKDASCGGLSSDGRVRGVAARRLSPSCDVFQCLGFVSFFKKKRVAHCCA